MDRDRVLMMARVKNEGRWIYRSLERVWQVCGKVALLDDNSTDNMCAEVLRSMGLPGGIYLGRTHHRPEFQDDSDAFLEHHCWGFVARSQGPYGPMELHYIFSPYDGGVRAKEVTNEVRDKNHLWYMVKANIDFDHVLCMDGDEMPSLALVREFPEAIQKLEDGADFLNIGFVYLWDGENQIRVDGVYGRAVDGLPLLRFPRLFTIKRVPEHLLFKMYFRTYEGNAGGFHCGSIPRDYFRRDGPGPMGEEITDGGVLRSPMVHFGYIDDGIRHRKFDFYTRIDPNNKTEGGYLHIIGKRNCHQPGDVWLQPWEDA